MSSTDDATADKEHGGKPYSRRPGIAVDAGGGPVIDPTKNVLDLVDAESKYQNGMREASDRLNKARVDHADRYQTALRSAESQIQNWMRDSEMKRLAELAAERKRYEDTIADMLRASVQSTSQLVSAQLLQIQSTFDTRISQLERFRYELGGKSSVSDPALNEALTRMAGAIDSLQTIGSAQSGVGKGHNEMIGWIVGGIMLVVAIISSVVGVASYSKPAGTVSVIPPATIHAQ